MAVDSLPPPSAHSRERRRVPALPSSATIQYKTMSAEARYLKNIYISHRY